jgi:hypothetical protein
VARQSTLEHTTTGRPSCTRNADIVHAADLCATTRGVRPQGSACGRGGARRSALVRARARSPPACVCVWSSAFRLVRWLPHSCFVGTPWSLPGILRWAEAPARSLRPLKPRMAQSAEWQGQWVGAVPGPEVPLLRARPHSPPPVGLRAPVGRALWPPPFAPPPHALIFPRSTFPWYHKFEGVLVSARAPLELARRGR